MACRRQLTGRNRTLEPRGKSKTGTPRRDRQARHDRAGGEDLGLHISHAREKLRIGLIPFPSDVLTVMTSAPYIIQQEEVDAIVVGSGISGGWAAKELCEKGLNTLVLERGRHVEHGTDYVTEHMP
ncbi:MAG: NAD(P)-binding protein, partial [Rhodothermales bacterium]